MYFNAKEYASYLNSTTATHERVNMRYSKLTSDARYQCRYDNDGHLEHPTIDLRAEFSEEEAATTLDEAKKSILSRNGNGYGKWLRPWDVVPALANWSAPEGDYGIGVEVEMGFVNRKAAQIVAAHIEPWEYITLDWEGGEHPIEATFPPVPYSKIKHSRVVEYLNYLTENEKLVVKHDPQGIVGTHINVSRGGARIPTQRAHAIGHCIQSIIDTNWDYAVRYFGRRPYGYAFPQKTTGDGTCAWVELKLFNSQLSAERLMQYINIAVCIIELVCDESKEMNAANMHLALEKGYTMDCANVSNDEYTPYEYAIAA